MFSLRDQLKRAALAVFVLAVMQAASAEENKTGLFKVVTIKDEIIIGLSADELKALGGTDASAIAHALAQKGDLTVWQYNVHRGPNGELQQAPKQSKIPLVYVNRQPANLDSLPAGQAFVASNESDSGTLETKQVCKLLKDAGKGKGANIYVMEGILSNQSARQRTQDVHDVMATPDCNFIKIIDKQTANYQRDEAQSLMANWLTTGTKFDAVIANNDEMAIGALQAMKASGMDTKAVIVGGIDSTQDALASMKAGDLKVTVFQDAAGQGKGSVDAAVKLAKGDKVDKTVWIPFQLVTPETMSNFMKKN